VIHVNSAVTTGVSDADADPVPTMASRRDRKSAAAGVLMVRRRLLPAVGTSSTPASIRLWGRGFGFAKTDFSSYSGTTECDWMRPGGAAAENRARSCCDRAPIDRLAARTYWQLEAIILTESTFSFGAFVVEPVLVALLAEAPP